MTARLYLIVSALGLLPVALIYGVNPSGILPKLTDISVETTDHIHVFRAITGLYMAMIVLWLIGALRGGWALTAVVSEIVFMFGLGFGRLVSIAVDGKPSLFFIGSTLAEFVLGIWGVLILIKLKKAGLPTSGS
jgi:hypothetical protein